MDIYIAYSPKLFPDYQLDCHGHEPFIMVQIKIGKCQHLLDKKKNDKNAFGSKFPEGTLGKRGAFGPE